MAVFVVLTNCSSEVGAKVMQFHPHFSIIFIHVELVFTLSMDGLFVTGREGTNNHHRQWNVQETYRLFSYSDQFEDF